MVVPQLWPRQRRLSLGVAAYVLNRRRLASAAPQPQRQRHQQQRPPTSSAFSCARARGVHLHGVRGGSERDRPEYTVTGSAYLYAAHESLCPSLVVLSLS